MARIQVLQLGEPGFVVIVDRLDPQDHAILFDADPRLPLKSELGARAVLVYDGELSVENLDEALTELLAPKVLDMLAAS